MKAPESSGTGVPSKASPIGTAMNTDRIVETAETTEAAAFPAWFLWSFSIFFLAGLSFGNLTALALQPMGHVAGTAASVVSAVSTIFAVFVAAPIGLAFDGTPVPLLSGALVCAGLGWLLMRGSRDYEAEQAG